MKKIIIPLVTVILLGGCASNNMGPNQAVGGVLGAAAGGLVGAQFGSGNGQLAGVAIGALIGAYAGSQMGQGVDNAYNNQ